MKTLNRASWILVLLLLFIAPNYAIGQQKLSWQQAFGFDRGPASFLRVSHPTWQSPPLSGHCDYFNIDVWQSVPDLAAPQASFPPDSTGWLWVMELQTRRIAGLSDVFDQQIHFASGVPSSSPRSVAVENFPFIGLLSTDQHFVSLVGGWMTVVTVRAASEEFSIVTLEHLHVFNDMSIAQRWLSFWDSQFDPGGGSDLDTPMVAEQIESASVLIKQASVLSMPDEGVWFDASGPLAPPGFTLPGETPEQRCWRLYYTNMGSCMRDFIRDQNACLRELRTEFDRIRREYALNRKRSWYDQVGTIVTAGTTVVGVTCAVSGAASCALGKTALFASAGAASASAAKIFFAGGALLAGAGLTALEINQLLNNAATEAAMD